MEINNIDSKNLIITTEFGSKIEIKNNQTIIFGNNEIGLNKIKSIGDFTNDVDEDNLEDSIKNKKSNQNIGYVLVVIILFITYYFTLWKPKDLRITIIAILLGIFIFIGKLYLQISILKTLDFSKKNYKLQIVCESSGNKTKKTYTICNGSLKELKHIKKLLLEKKEASLLS